MHKSARILLVALITVGAVFGTAGTRAWWNAWVFIAFIAVLGHFTNMLINSTPVL